MFTGIIETQAVVQAVKSDDQGVMRVTFTSPISSLLKIDQSVSHDGVCLTVVAFNDFSHTVEIIEETLRHTHFSTLSPGKKVNIERAMLTGARLDGHMVQGHVDTLGKVKSIVDNDFIFSHPDEFDSLVVMKGSICINGVSMTVSHVAQGELGVSLIPYTLEHTGFGALAIGDDVNLEFDILGKYVQKNLAHRSSENRAEAM
jgi:riboflavin synthase